MNPVMVATKLKEWTIANSGLESRTYLGMSRIGECPQMLARELSNGKRWTNEDALRCYAGYLWEADVKSRLETLGIYKRGSERELVAEFDHRYMGHTDGELRDGSLLEIKSTVQEKLNQIRRDKRIPLKNYRQVQTYMRHGHYAQALVVFVARDTGDLYTHTVIPDRACMDVMDEKALSILAALDAGELPTCTCNRC